MRSSTVIDAFPSRIFQSPAGRLLSALLVATALLGAAPGDPLQMEAESLAARILIADSHIDYPEMSKPTDDLTKGVVGHFDFPRARRGGLKAAFMAIYVAPEEDAKGLATQTADARIQLVESLVKRWPTACALARTPTEVRKNAAAGRLSLPMGMENGAPLGENLGNVQRYYDQGIRYITLCHMKNNQLCDSSTDTSATWKGLSPFGRKVVVEMNRLGMMIDVSHTSDDTFAQVLALSKAPVIASHSSCRTFTAPGTFGYKRNLSDNMIRALAKKGGVIQINFGSIFLGNDYGKYGVVSDVKDVAAHIHHAIQVAGVDHVGIGSDFDGVGHSVPTGLEDVSRYPNLIRELLKLGYGAGDIEKIFGGNLLRVWSEVERVASGS
jgi:membrane dipeptidase